MIVKTKTTITVVITLIDISRRGLQSTNDGFPESPLKNKSVKYTYISQIQK